MRENRPYGSEGGAARKGRSYPYPQAAGFLYRTIYLPVPTAWTRQFTSFSCAGQMSLGSKCATWLSKKKMVAFTSMGGANTAKVPHDRFNPRFGYDRSIFAHGPKGGTSGGRIAVPGARDFSNQRRLGGPRWIDAVLPFGGEWRFWGWTAIATFGARQPTVHGIIGREPLVANKFVGIISGYPPRPESRR